MEKKFEYLNHVADAEFIAYGATIDEAFENSALAMVGLMIDTATIKPTVEKEIELSNDALDLLISDWLAELLFILEVDRLIFGKFTVHVEHKDSVYDLKATAYGESLDAHPDVYMHIKAVTFHDLRFEKRNNIYEAQVLLDI